MSKLEGRMILLSIAVAAVLVTPPLIFSSDDNAFMNIERVYGAALLGLSLIWLISWVGIGIGVCLHKLWKGEVK